MTRAAVRRRGFTLLEVLLAAVIAVMLMGALYAALDVTLARTQANREAIDASDLSRAVVNRLTADLSASVGPLQPKSGGTPFTGDSSGASGGSTPAAAPTTGSGAATTPAADPTTAADPAADTATTGTVDIPLHGGMIGTEKQLTVFATRVPAGLTDPEAITSPDVLRPADLRRVIYYLGSAGGLCRQERFWVTADGVRNSADPDFTTEDADLIAPEVADISFEYYDGGTWVTEWDGSQTGLDGVALMGPPRAIRITLTLNVPGRNGTTTQKVVQHVVAVRAAVGTYTPPTDDTTTTTGGTSP